MHVTEFFFRNILSFEQCKMLHNTQTFFLFIRDRNLLDE
jgi:hypothetical protein